MYELIKISEHDYYINMPVKVGVVKVFDDEVIIIDSGNDKDAGRKILKVLDENSWKLRAIFNTHSHADHIGGNKVIQDRTGCKIYGNGLEVDFINNPLLEPISLYAGVPHKELKHKFLMAKESIAENIKDSALPFGMEVINLKGHSVDMVGFKTEDGNIFLGDAIAPIETIEKYGIPFLWDPMEYVETLEKVKTLEGNYYIPSHFAATGDINEIIKIADYNIETIKRVEDKILNFCETPIGFDELLSKLFKEFNMTISISQHALIGTTIRSFVSNLLDRGALQTVFSNNVLVYERV